MSEQLPHQMDRRPWWAHLALAAFYLACAAHLWGLYSPRVDLPSEAPNTDKWAHLAGFGVPVVLGWLLFRAHRLWIVAIFAAHAVISELVQHWILPGRTGDPVDAAADLAGVALGVAVGWLATTIVDHWSSRRVGHPQ